MATVTGTLTTPEHRLKSAFRQLRKSGISARLNVQGCCRSCLGAEERAELQPPVVYHYGGQGSRVTWRDGLPVYADQVARRARGWQCPAGDVTYRDLGERARVRVMYLTHDLTDEQAWDVVGTLRAAGLDVRWEGDHYRTIEVHFAHPEDADE